MNKRSILMAAVVLVLLVHPQPVRPQQPAIRPVSLGEAMPDFTLPTFQGGDLHFADLKGKTVILVFLRGLAGKDHWCHVCNYQYMEFIEAERSGDLRRKENLEVVFVLPYDRAMTRQWAEAFPAQLKDIADWKNPPPDQQADPKVRQRMERYRRAFPKEYRVAAGDFPAPFPILTDGERVLCKGLGVFAEEWSGSKIEQNIPSVFIVDPQGIVQFKYISQNTLDRPGLPYLLKTIRCMKQAP